LIKDFKKVFGKEKNFISQYADVAEVIINKRFGERE
jgi:hypothetical protein